VLPPDLLISGVTDSKKLAEPERERLYDLILKLALAYGIGVVDERTIDEVNIYQATIMAMERALECIAPPPDYLLIDALSLPRIPIPQHPLIKGDLRSHTIAAASIVAKVTRDRLMKELHGKYPQYNFHKHKGYGTKEHLSLIRKHGPCEAHRKSFHPISGMVKGACP
jgi:ribonuclease HII